ncbi:hypothetical protein LOK49_LG04G02106 [Camellia lanceoleosa]|uniref:Uncharacterized protein n=1 Tax=Camellia lanceoleosa TaxID=1840588 RepID=A0ACC0I0D4_9ERIC|nr:hypothetical protein LOK49_LG04G02106 [Camellia lanceoleosa]
MAPELNIIPISADRSGQLLLALVNISGPLMEYGVQREACVVSICLETVVTTSSTLQTTVKMGYIQGLKCMVSALELYEVENSDGENKQQVVSLINYVQSKRGNMMWENEVPTVVRPELPSAALLSALVQSMVDAIFFQGDLRETWGTEALKWAMECTSRHLVFGKSSTCSFGIHYGNSIDLTSDGGEYKAYKSNTLPPTFLELSHDVVVGPTSLLQQQQQKACSVAANLSIWCRAKSLDELAMVFMAYSHGEIKSIDNLLACVSPLLCNEWFPKHSTLAFGHLLRLLEKGLVEYQRVILLMLKALLQHTPMDVAQSPHMYAIVSQLVESTLCWETLSVLEALLQSCGSTTGSHPHDPGFFENGPGGTDEKLLVPHTSFKAKSGPL